MEAASQSVLKGQPIYRILQESVRFPEMYEIDVSAQAIAVGPESDFGTFDVYYPDPLSTDGIARATLTPDRPWIAKTNANLVENYSQISKAVPTVEGKIYLVPSDFQAALSASFPGLYEPTVDIIAYTTNLPPILPKRTPRLFRGPTGAIFAGGRKYYISSYRRRFITIIVDIIDYVGDIDVTVKGLQKYFPIFGTTGRVLVDLAGPTNISSAGTKRFVFKYDAQDPANTAGGQFEQFELSLTNPNPVLSNPETLPAVGIQMTVELSD